MIAIIVAVVLVVAGGAIGGFLVLGGDDDDDSSNGTSGATIEGDGYSYDIPEGWQDASEDGASGVIDTMIQVEEPEDGFATNMLVEVHPSQGATDVQALKSTWESNVGGAVDGTPEDIEDTTIDSEDAVGLRVESNQNGKDVVQFAYLVISGDKLYSIAMSAGANGEDAASDTFQQILDSWSWQ